MTTKTSKRYKFDIAESKYLNEMMEQAVHIVHTLDELCENKGMDIEDLDVPCTIRAELAYDLCSAITHMYEKLLKHELVTTGNKTNQYTLH